MRTRLRTGVRWLAVAATVGMFIVLVMGSTVTNTGSADGCGRSWPLCNGRFIPTFAVSTAIEYSHRAVTGIEGLLIVATAVGVLAFWRRRTEIKILVPLMLFFLFLQAGLGALAVKFPTSNEVLALHFGISLVAFASVLLTTTFIFAADSNLDALRDRTVPRGVALGAWGLGIYTYGVVYLGAYVNHTQSSLACLDWPLCQGSVFPGFTGPVGIAFSHRFAALILTIGVAALTLWCWRQRAARPDLARAAVITLVTLLLQSAVGAAVVFSRLHLFTVLAHGAVVTLFFGALAYICLNVLPRPARVRAGEQANERAGETAPGRRGAVVPGQRIDLPTH